MGLALSVLQGARCCEATRQGTLESVQTTQQRTVVPPLQRVFLLFTTPSLLPPMPASGCPDQRPSHCSVPPKMYSVAPTSSASRRDTELPTQRTRQEVLRGLKTLKAALQRQHRSTKEREGVKHKLRSWCGEPHSPAPPWSGCREGWRGGGSSLQDSGFCVRAGGMFAEKES
jgi:hypothetical protein